MKELLELSTVEQIDDLIASSDLVFLYISRPNCSVCHALLPQVQELLMKYPEIKLGHINADEVPEVAGKFSIFTIPVLLLFYQQKEYIREARIVHLELLDERINNIYKNVVG